jgi:hypothetical protein
VEAVRVFRVVLKSVTTYAHCRQPERVDDSAGTWCDIAVRVKEEMTADIFDEPVRGY